MRCDVNISVKRDGVIKERCEIKNMNSFSNIAKAIESEYKRQLAIIESGNEVTRGTLRYNESQNITEPMRLKEDSSDYRYFDEPDILPICIDDEFISFISTTIPRLPNEIMAEFTKSYQLKDEDAYMIVRYKPICEFFSELLKLTNNPRLSSMLITKHLFSLIGDDNERDNPNLLPNPEYVAEIILRLEEKRLSANLVKAVFEKVFRYNKPIAELFSDDELIPVRIEDYADEIIAVINGNPKIVSDYKSGKDKALSALIGLSMKATKGRADANEVKNLILKQINTN